MRRYCTGVLGAVPVLVFPRSGARWSPFGYAENMTLRPSQSTEPAERWLLLEPDQHPQEAHEAFAEDVAAAMLAARAHPDGIRVVTHLLVTVEESDASLERLKKLTTGSHWQDVRVELPQLFALPTSLAATRGNVRSLQLLLERGALVAWPETTGPDWDDQEKIGGGFVAYTGVYPSALVEAARRAALADVTFPEMFAAMALLEDHGADPLKDDPACGRNAVEEVVRIIDAIGPSEWLVGTDALEAWVPIWDRWCKKSPALKRAIQEKALEDAEGVLEDVGLADRLRSVWLEQSLDHTLPPSALASRGPRL